MGLLRGVARTAVVAGTATAVSNRVSRRQAGRWAAQDDQAAGQQQYAQPPQQYAAAPAPAAAVPMADDMSSKIDQLKELGALKEQGILTEAEFAEQKSKILGA
ncbi:SHOCT domain-containing protein [Streptomyces sp. NPDC048357]|uniref:SHOCT domain-containing protein n=1 Tax=Streptomyces sp. NPDC048357 TaxID=3154719 RepID=UPI00343CC5E3